jgi:hypothetical protein
VHLHLPTQQIRLDMSEFMHTYMKQLDVTQLLCWTVCAYLTDPAGHVKSPCLLT